ncbi:TauD/TfdA dioxygenase family protein [Novosphingobium mangrovi (ex Huang et al. 2023)]|uniref:TauD/TfdA family dioxygenase n=1 Tax=Novosphingobium mangrovi (ex Huang et al. 2023) TaxID=2976432 RepID=A0ABT2I5E3_9SPHN|nr:TauD/TfdA family dioxygenase [Novosphingobium mangrovi (ex Huang et al. 2023)]MCT2400037.1 TauD/TfdA family dioxygenase [Novosphingobium mangrovi (ex Huang et al. 2023)]
MAVTLPFRRLAPFGVEIDFDLSQPLAPSLSYHFRELWREHGLVLARGQSLTMARQRELCALLGPILLREGEGETMSNEGGGPSASPLSWHADAAYTDAPFGAIALHALDVVDDVSSTRFTNAEAGLARLPQDMAGALDGCEQEMISPHYTRLAGRTCDDREPEAMKRGVRPAILENPHNGRPCLWVSELQTARLLGMAWEESRDLLNAVFDRLYAPEHVLEHKWRTGDVIFWDNIALQHARGNLQSVGRRVLQRVIVGTDGVAPHVAG